MYILPQVKHININQKSPNWSYKISVTKGPTQNKTYHHHSRISKLVLTTGKHQKYAEKVNKISKKY